MHFMSEMFCQIIFHYEYFLMYLYAWKQKGNNMGLLFLFTGNYVMMVTSNQAATIIQFKKNKKHSFCAQWNVNFLFPFLFFLFLN